MKTNTLNSKTNLEQSIVSNCSIMTLLGQTSQGLMYTDGVTYTFIDMEKEKGLVIEHKATSRAPLSQHTLRFLDYMLLNIDPDNHVRISGSELVDVFGSVMNVIGYLQAIRQLEIHTRIINTATQKSVLHRFGIVESVSFEDDFGCKEWAEVRPDTIIDIKLYDHFCDIYLGHIIPDYQISVDYVALGQKGLIGEIAKEFVDDARAKIEKEKTEKTDEENEDEEGEENEDEEGEERDEEDEEENAGDNDESTEEEDSQNKTNNAEPVDILISVRQLRRMFDDECHDDDFYMSEDGYFVKYRGEGGDVVIPQGAFLIGNSAFEGCVGLKSVKIPNSVKIICKDAFKDCVNLEEVEMPLDMLKLLMSNVDFCFSGTPISEMLKKKDLFFKKYKVEIKAERIEEAIDDNEEDNENEKDENEEEDTNGDKDDSEKEKDDNGDGASTEKP